MSLQERSAKALLHDPARPAIEYEGRWHDWGAVARTARALQAALSAGGVRDGAPIAFVPRNRPEALAALLGLVAQGRTIRMIYAFQAPVGIARNLAEREAAALVASAEDLAPEVLEAAAHREMAVVALDGMAVRLLQPAGAPGCKPGSTEPQIEILTSGTTGPPKSFALPYSLLETHFLGSPLTEREGEDARTAPPFLLYFPIGNISGLYSTLPMLIRGQRMVLLERFTLPAWRQYLNRYRPTHAGLPPSYIRAVLDAQVPVEELASLRTIGTGAAPLDSDVQQAFEARYAIPILLSYGATEFAGPVAMMTPALHAEWGERKRGTVGRAMPGAQLRIVDAESGSIMPFDSPGLLEVISPRIGPGWIRTSDVARIDKDGFLFLMGRADGAIMRGGFKLLPEAIERVLMQHPDIAEAAVTGIDDDRLGQVPAAAIRLAPGVSPPDLAMLEAHVRAHLLAPHVPAKWLFCEEFPRTPSLKTDRQALRRLFLEEVII
ncbi:fatty acid--CoA ligase family protein [Sphingobium sp. BYY-5]|uniref:class I adenylate-forming enzyme family protein n=1 Tax=Sphingobium sp. BYY-5 TaxID=2926400 RepID=UPI001FA74774|nr:fatty acid--CoA ligase family protein [Sphingobium sp. BYY-5]MCI4592042.1 fatty acid--CoA ligase family protein [Sphingobium sp. BYY-5]